MSHRVTEGQELEGLVTPDIIPTLQDGVSKMSLAQRDLIPVEVDDIYFSFPYQVYHFTYSSKSGYQFEFFR